MIILFDLDGTLIDSTDAILHCFHNSFKVAGLEKREDEDIKSLIGYPLDIMYEKLKVSEDKIWDMVALYKSCYRKISKEMTELLPNAKEAIEEASKIARLGIVTTKTARYSKELLEHMGVLDSFEVLIGREDVKNPKPHSEPISKALERMGDFEGRKIFMIGDTKLDLICAKEAGVKGVGVLCGYGKEEELKKHCDMVFKDSLEAIKHLKTT